MRIIAVANIKGGVGKTTTAVNLAYLLGASGQRTVLWDLDSQGAATYTLRVDPRERIPAATPALDTRRLPEFVLRTRYVNLDLIPANLCCRKFDLLLPEHKRPVARLLKMNRPLRELYDTLILDCPSGISLRSESVLSAADVIVAPIVPTPLSIRMLEQLYDFVAAEGWPDLLLLPFFSMVDRRRTLHLDTIASTRRKFPNMLVTEVPYWSEIERMSVRRAPLPAIAPNSPATQISNALGSEIAHRMEWPARAPGYRHEWAAERRIATDAGGARAQSGRRLSVGNERLH